ncbi:MAG TPA: hypothetical protein VFS67_15940 [Polyangiaceae bacterium]|nr:hypothetical protein [Polyangiaceae bacterium]
MISRVCVASLGVLGGLLVAGGAGAAEAAASTDASAGGALPAEHTNADTTSGGGAASRPARGMHNSISLLLNLGYAYSAGTGLGVSGRYQYTVVPEGFLHSSSIRDDFGVEAAVDFFHYSWDLLGYSWTYNEVGLSASAVWNLWFSEQFAAYPRLGLGFAFGSFSDNTGFSAPGGYGGLFLVGGAGVLYELAPVTLRAEVSNNYLGLGAAISL